MTAILIALVLKVWSWEQLHCYHLGLIYSLGSLNQGPQMGFRKSTMQHFVGMYILRGGEGRENQSFPSESQPLALQKLIQSILQLSIINT